MSDPFTIDDWDFSPDQLMSPYEVARAFGVGVKAVASWRKAGKLASFTTPGGHRRYSRQQIEALLRGEATS